MIGRALAIAIGCFWVFNSIAGTVGPAATLHDNPDNRWSLVASLGYGQYEQMYHSTGHVVIGRLALAAELLATTQSNFGLELGLQNGNNMILALAKKGVNTPCCSVQANVTPMLDLLMTVNANLLSESLLYTQIKGGLAYRHWQTANDWINNRRDIAGEVQAGLGYPLTELTNLNLLYQGIYGINSRTHSNQVMFPGFLASIPVQHGILLGLSVIV